MKNSKLKIVGQRHPSTSLRTSAFADIGFNTEGDNNDKSKTRGKFA